MHALELESKHWPSLRIEPEGKCMLYVQRFDCHCLPRAWTILGFLYLFCGDQVSELLPAFSTQRLLH